MLAATGWKLEYIPRVTSFQSEGEMTYRPRDGRPRVIQFEDAEKMEYHPHHPLQFIEKNTFFFLSFDMKGGKDYRSDCCFFAGEKDSHDSHSVGIQWDLRLGHMILAASAGWFALDLVDGHCKYRDNRANHHVAKCSRGQPMTSSTHEKVKN